MDISPYTGGIAEVLQTRSDYGAPRWWWDGANLRLLDPIPIETIHLG